MKKFWIALMCLASPVMADDTSMYDSPETFLADLKQMSVRCAAMVEGQVDNEIFGITFERGTDARCTLGTGEIDPLVSAFFAENELSWAGITGGDSIWVAAQ